jgi:uncharacterized Zn-binding protein involved in type VI secretion
MKGHIAATERTLSPRWAQIDANIGGLARQCNGAANREQKKMETNRPFIVLGDKTNHGGVVITASENTFTDERRVARIGDLVVCPIPGHGTNPIVTASPYVTIDGRQVARHHDLTACGSLLIASQLDSASE